MFNHRLTRAAFCKYFHSAHTELTAPASSRATLANCKASKGILSLKLTFGPALFY